EALDALPPADRAILVDYYRAANAREPLDAHLARLRLFGRLLPKEILFQRLDADAHRAFAAFIARQDDGHVAAAVTAFRREPRAARTVADRGECTREEATRLVERAIAWLDRKLRGEMP